MESSFLSLAAASTYGATSHSPSPSLKISKQVPVRHDPSEDANAFLHLHLPNLSPSFPILFFSILSSQFVSILHGELSTTANYPFHFVSTIFIILQNNRCQLDHVHKGELVMQQLPPLVSLSSQYCTTLSCSSSFPTWLCTITQRGLAEPSVLPKGHCPPITYTPAQTPLQQLCPL